ncbi:MAG: hypothetical protein IJW75_05560 [Alphaproteobacteria bacterium]|nr:hypothetical protein [Alphaproteobacteria bacterium]
MNFIKLHKICFALAIGAISALCAIKDTGATYKNAKGYTIREMMERRSNGKRSDMAKKATIKKDKVRKSKVKKSPVKTSSEINVVKNTSLPVNVDENVSEQITVQNNVTKKKSGFFDFNSGPLFDTGSCATNNKSGPLFDAGPCKRCQSGPLIDTGPCETCKKPEPRIANYAVDYKEYVYQAVARNCCDMAPIYLDHVDFNLFSQSDYLPYSNKMGNYRFRIFGCRRYDKEAILNQGRVLEKNMNFSKVFEEQTADCYNIVKMPQDLCLQNTPSPLPEYILSAEITDFFMNVCDGYDWQQSQKEEKRTGSAEIKVTWKLTNLTKTKVIWEGETYGYSDLTKGDATGEIALVEKAFADAVSNLRNKAGFEDKLMVRLTPEELTNERNALIDEEIALNPAKCQFKE